MEAALATGVTDLASAVERDGDLTPQPWHATFEDPGEPTPAEAAAYKAEADRIDALTENDVLVVQARAYATEAERLLPALRASIAGDPVLGAALDTISWHDFLLYVKMARAISGQLEQDDDEDEDPIQTDPNGTAKLVRLLLKESRDAWEVLAQVGPGDHDDLAHGMIERLEELDELVEARFPHAMEFIRPGFDERSDR
jgi:hypothetical protein